MPKNKTLNLGKTLAGAIAVGTLVMPIVKGRNGSSVIGELRAGRPQGAAEVFVRDAREAVSFTNILKASAPVFGFAAVSYGAKALGASAPRLGKVRLW